MSPAAAQIGLLFSPHRVHRHSISPQKDRRALLQSCQSSRSASIREWQGSNCGRRVGCSEDLQEPKDRAGWSSDFPTPLLPATLLPALDNRLAPNPVARIAGVAYWAEVSSKPERSSCTGECCQ